MREYSLADLDDWRCGTICKINEKLRLTGIRRICDNSRHQPTGVTDMQIQTIVTIDRDWQDKFKQDDAVIPMRVAFHVSIDPITQQKSCTIFTDDGRGNGLPVLSFDMS